jgi:hypothetical protein
MRGLQTDTVSAAGAVGASTTLAIGAESARSAAGARRRVAGLPVRAIGVAGALDAGSIAAIGRGRGAIAAAATADAPGAGAELPCPGIHALCVAQARKTELVVGIGCVGVAVGVGAIRVAGATVAEAAHHASTRQGGDVVTQQAAAVGCRIATAGVAGIAHGHANRRVAAALAAVLALADRVDAALAGGAVGGGGATAAKPAGATR